MTRQSCEKTRAVFCRLMTALVLVLMPSVCLAGVVLTLNQINIERFPQINIYLTIADERGTPIKGLEINNFKVQEDGRMVQVKGVFPLEKGDEPLSVVLAIDRSGSMRGQPIKDALKAAKDFIREMRAIDRVGLVSFDDHVTVISRPNADKAPLLKEIDKIKVGKDTALNDGVMKSLQLLSPFIGRRAVIVLTDGRENRSKTTREEIIKQAAGMGVPIITVGLGQEVDIDALDAMADGSGGRPYFARESSELSVLYQEIARQLINQYRVTLQSRKSLDNGWHKLRVELKIAKSKAQVERLYLATLKPVVPTAALEAYREGMNWLFLLASILCAVVVALAAVIIVIAVKSSKKA